MLNKMYALMDFTAGNFLNPFTVKNDAEAIRLMTTWVNDATQPTNINKYPHQFALFYLGEFDDQLGTYTNNEKGPKEIITAISVQTESERTFTVKELITMLEQKLNTKYIDERIHDIEEDIHNLKAGGTK